MPRGSWNTVSDYMRGRGRRGGGGRRKGSGLSDLWKPPGEDSPLASERVRLYPGQYAGCPACGAPNPVTSAGIKCWHCGVQTEVDKDTKIFGTMPNFQLFVPGGGKAKRGDTVVCRCFDGELKDANGDPRPCVLCYYGLQHKENALSDAEEEYGYGNIPGEVWGKANSKMPRSHMAHNLVRIGHFHPIEQKRQDGVPYTTYEPCLAGVRRGRGGRPLSCKYCKDEIPRVYGRRAYWNPSNPKGNRGHLARLRAYEDQHLSSCCANCGNVIQATSYTCPSCERVVIDCFDERIDDETIDKARSEEMACTHCGYEGFLSETIECIKETEDGEFVDGCNEPRRLSIFDVDLDMAIRGRKIDSSLEILGHHVCGVEPEIAKLMVPYDFRNLLDMSLTMQAQRMNVDNPYESGTGRTRSEEYDE